MSRAPVTANVAANLVNAGTSVGAAAISVPLALHYVGLAGFGVWTLAQTTLLYAATAETGFGPAVQRFVAVAHGAGDRQAAARVVWSASAFYVALGSLFAVAVALFAPAIVDLFDISPRLRPEAIEMFRITGIAMLLALVAAGLANVLQGVERFTSAALATAVTSAVFLVSAAVLLSRGHGLPGLAEAVVLQHAVGVAMRVWMVRDLLFGVPFSRISRVEARALAGFSARLQVAVLSTLVNSQTDKLVVGLVATTAAVGEVGIGGQVAEAVRFMAMAALGPVLARLAIVHGEGSPERLAKLFWQSEFIWLRLGIGVTAIACAVMQPVIEAWLGQEAGRAWLYGVLLTAAYGINILAGPAIAYLRAIGTPGLEARYGAITIVANIVLTIILGIAFGPVGVVSATLIAYAGGTAWLFLRLEGVVPPQTERRKPGLGRALLAAVVAAGAAMGWCLLAVEWLPRWVALAVCGAGAGAALAAYLAVALGVRPRALRGLILGDRVAAGVSRVAVVIPTWNGRELLARVLPTLAAQTFTDSRTIVVDNGSEDGSVQWLAREWPDVEVIALDHNIGFAPAVNLGIEHAAEEYVALLNNDMELDRGWLGALVDALDADPRLGSACPKQRSGRDRERLDGAGDELAWTGGASRRGVGELDHGQYDRAEDVFSACAGAAVYRSAALREVGLFDASFFAYLEDVDWGLRAQLAGWRARYVPEALVYHLGGATSGRIPERERYLIARNHVAFLLKNFPTSWLVRFSPLIAAELARALISAARNGQGRVVLRGWRAAARRAPATLRARRAVQATRQVPLAELETAVFGRRRTRRDWFSVRPDRQSAPC